jgi:hypothetical protein
MTYKEIEKGKLTLTWSPNLSIDNTDPLTYTYTDDGGFEQSAGIEDRRMTVSQKLKEDQSESIYFFKSDTALDYSTNGTVTVEPLDGKYTISIPKSDADTAGSSGNGSTEKLTPDDKEEEP